MRPYNACAIANIIVEGTNTVPATNMIQKGVGRRGGIDSPGLHQMLVNMKFGASLNCAWRNAQPTLNISKQLCTPVICLNLSW